MAKGVGYWISPSPANKVYRLTTTHIGMICSNPELFGTTKEDLEALFKKYDEKWGTEGKAREDAILAAVKKGWIRARHYPNVTMSFNTDRMNTKIAGVIEAFLRNTIKKGEIQDTYLPVVVDILNKKSMRLTIHDIINKFRLDTPNTATVLEFLEETRLTPLIVEQHMRLIASKVPLAELHPNVGRVIQEKGWADGKTD